MSRLRLLSAAALLAVAANSHAASEGAIRGVKLESALDHIRHQAPQLNATDAQLAQAILTI
ncbi:hypothetical protein D3C84_597490 [compost metagenome]